MEPKSHGQLVAETLAKRVGELSLEKAVLQAALELKTNECEAYKQQLSSSASSQNEEA